MITFDNSAQLENMIVLPSLYFFSTISCCTSVIHPCFRPCPTKRSATTPRSRNSGLSPINFVRTSVEKIVLVRRITETEVTFSETEVAFMDTFGYDRTWLLLQNMGVRQDSNNRICAKNISFYAGFNIMVMLINMIFVMQKQRQILI